MPRPVRSMSLLVLALLVVGDCANAGAAQPLPASQGPRFRTVARWFGELYARRHFGPTREPGAFGLRLSSPNSVQVTRANVVLREEIDERGIETRTVVEDVNWTSSVSELYYQNKDGSRVGAGNGGSGGSDCAESQLYVVEPARPEWLKEIQDRITKAQAEVAKWEREKAKAEAAAKQAESSQEQLKDLAAKRQAAQDEYERVLDDPNATDAQKAAATEAYQQANEAYRNALAGASHAPPGGTSVASAQRMIDNAKRDLDRAQYDLLRAEEGTRRWLVNAHVDAYTDPNTKKRMVGLNFGVPGAPRDRSDILNKMFAFDVDVAPLEPLGAFGTKVGSKYESTRWGANIPACSGTAELQDERAVMHKEFKSADGQVEESATFRRVGTREQLAVRGKVLYRVRIPEDANDKNVIVAPVTEKSVKEAIAVPGAVQVKAWLWDPNLREEGGRPLQARQPPIQTTQTRPGDGEFEFSLPPLPEQRVLRLELTYHNEKAQITEVQRIETSTGTLANLGKAAGDEGWSAPVDQVERTGACYVRYEGDPKGKELVLGGEERGAELRRKGGIVTLNFDGPGSVLINTFCFAAPYWNQNQQGFEVKAVVPCERLLAARPSGRDYSVPEVEVRARLPNGGRDALGKTDVKIRGSVVCFPTCQTMILGGLGVAIKPDPADPNPVKSIAQGVYDDFYERNKGTAPPWKFPYNFPFPEGQAAINAYTNLSLNVAAAKDAAARVKATQAFVKRYYDDWPYKDADSSDLNKTWLVTVAGAGYRPWQNVADFKAYLEKAYPLDISNALMVNVFDFGTTGGDVLRALGRGSLALVSIRHRDSGESHANGKPGEGGHGLVLLGAVVDNAGAVVRLIFHDPYGDQTQHPTVEGYYAYDKATQTNTHNPALVDYDRTGTRGAYAPYGPEIDSYDGRLEGKFWVTFTRRDAKNPSPGQLQSRLLPGELPKK